MTVRATASDPTMKIPPQLIAWPIAAMVLVFRSTCRLRVHGDPRPALKREKKPYVYSIFHAHQIAAAINTEPNTAAMVSQSVDGELLVKAFQALGVTPVRGSSRREGGGRGGAEAVDAMVEHVVNTGPAIIAVDGPRGPRGRVRKGIASLAKRSDAAVVNVILIPSWRITIRGAWDRFQMPIPFCRIDAYFAEPVRPQPNESVESIRRRVEVALNDLEREHDPGEASPVESAPKSMAA